MHPAPPSAARQRSRRFQLNASALLGSRMLTVGLALAQVAVALPHLGEARYGAWMLLLAAAATIHMADFGVGLGVQQAMAAALAKGNGESARRFAHRGTIWLGLQGVVVAAVFPALAWWLPWTTWTGLDAFASEARVAAAVLAILTAAALPLNIAPRLAAAAQMHWLQGFWAVIGSAATLAWVAATAALGAGLVAIVAGAATIAVLQNCGMLWQVLGRLAWRNAGWPELAAPDRLALRQACWGYAVPQFGLALIQAAPSTALSLSGGPAAVAAFNLVQRLLTPLTQAHGLVQMTLWPSYTDAAVRGDAGWVRRNFARSLAGSAVVCALMMAVTSGAGWIIPWWTRQSVAPLDPAVAWLTASWCAVLVLTQCLTSLLVGLGEWRRLARVAAWGYPAATCACLLGIQSGPAGTLAAGTLALLFVLLPLLSWASAVSLRALRTPPDE